jgi:hypothetical protein
VHEVVASAVGACTALSRPERTCTRRRQAAILLSPRDLPHEPDSTPRRTLAIEVASYENESSALTYRTAVAIPSARDNSHSCHCPEEPRSEVDDNRFL